ncbi:precorrin-6A reductase [Clostridium sp. MCC353]|uniref:precorrin-6A reductase n=1 Tax=Clostridium sp. MCC353 TaxID=2592646 RepID=UPI001C010FBD|nr:precorrin-6A reductase [Clostridium sp. MCC353]MBT9775277.1 precorrin-6A reductase [Clostridium sp. MCC353]
MKAVLIFAGTSEGRELASFLSGAGIESWVSVATEYGETLLPKEENITAVTGYKDRQEMEIFLREHDFSCVVDATHPFAQKATEHIKGACKDADVPYYRLLREEEHEMAGDAVYVGSVREAAEYLEQTKGNVMVTTGSKELDPYMELTDPSRLYFRILPSAPSLALCQARNIPPKNIIAMQGPFGRELNAALIRQLDCRYLVTKASGQAGGFSEKIQACRDTGAVPVVIKRPEEADGQSMGEIKKLLLKLYGMKEKPAVTIAGTGPGSEAMMTAEVLQALTKADACIGSGRMLDGAKKRGKPVFDSYRPEEIKAWIEAHPEYRNILILMSGDPGFYSGTKKLLDQLSGYQADVLPGISSLSAFCAKLGISWDDMVLCSVHGRRQNLIQKIRHNRKVFALLGKEDEFRKLCGLMLDYGMEDVTVCVGDSLSYEQERIFKGTPKTALNEKFSNLSCAVFINERFEAKKLRLGIPEEEFIRDKVPMTKDEVRCISVAKLQLQRDSIIYDIGAGTGSVSVEMAMASEDGMVYAVEKKPLAAELIGKNRDKFRITNLEIIEGTAPEAISDLPAPTHAFIGGSSGNLKEIVGILKQKNPAVRIVINAIALETVAEIAALGGEYEMEIVQIQAAKGKKAGSYHLMMGQNPVTIAVIE